MIGSLTVLACLGILFATVGGITWIEGHRRVARYLWVVAVVHITPLIVQLWLIVIMEATK